MVIVYVSFQNMLMQLIIIKCYYNSNLHFQYIVLNLLQTF